MTAKSSIFTKGFNLMERDIRNLELSYITEDLAKKAGLFRVNSAEGAQLIGRNGSADYSGIVFPYIYPAESSPRVYRLRRDKPDTEKKSDGTIRQKAKYLSPPGCGNKLYFMPKTPSAWLKDVSLPICITEGEKKTIALYRLSLHNVKNESPRFLAIGISGVWNWRGIISKEFGADGKQHDIKGAIADLDLLHWQGRKVFIIFDTNVSTNESVNAARVALSRELISRGAVVYFVNLPAKSGVNGVDDLLAAQGAEYVLGLIDTASLYIEAKATRSSARSQLLSITENLELFHYEGEAFATNSIKNHKEAYAIRSKMFRQYLSAKIYEIEGKGANSQAIQEVIETLQGRALFSGVERTTFRRIAEANGKIYIDLCNRDWEAIEISETGWRVTKEYPVSFLRSRGMLALPAPEYGGSLADLREFINIGSDENFALMKGWLVQTLRYDVPYALLAIGGEQGSAKSTAANVLRSLIDPNAALLRRPPRDERDLMAAARNSWIISLNNLSSIPLWLSDALCCLSVDGGFASRELYTDGEEFILNARRPIILTSIEDVIGKSDLIDRTVSLVLPQIPENKREKERDLWGRFKNAQPKLLGALCDYASTALKNLPNTKITNLPRMADFAEWGVAAEGTIEQTSIFLQSYRAMRQTNVENILEASPLAAVLLRFIGNDQRWSGTASDLLAELDSIATDKEKTRKSYPKGANVLSNKLREIAPNIRQAGVNIELGNRKGKKGSRVINIEQIDNLSSPSSDELFHTTNTLSSDISKADNKLTMGEGKQVMAIKPSSANHSQQYKNLETITDETDDADSNLHRYSYNPFPQLMAGNPFIITEEMEKQLLELGYSDYEINRMTTEYARQIIEESPTHLRLS